MTPRPLRATLWLFGLAAALVSLRMAGTGELAPPPLRSLDDLSTWADAREPVAAAMAMVRLVAEGAVWYLLGLSVLHGIAATRRVPGTGAVAEALALPGASRLVRAGLGVGLLAATAAASDPAAAPTAPTMERLPAATPDAVLQERIEPRTATMRPVEGEGTGTAWMTPLEDGEAPSTSTDVLVDEPAPPAATPSTWQVAPGESFWIIAEEVLAEAWHRSPTDEEVDPFWRALVEANRDRLVGDDPDQILPGQVFEVPAVPPPPH